MKILLTNDDGIYAEGLWALHKRFAKKHSVTVVAPERERSAVGHSITLHKPLRKSRVLVNGCGWGFAVNGNPADCIKLGVLEILDSKPDMVIAGINPGANVGVNINYSGTVSAAREAALYGIPAIAVSIQAFVTQHYDDAACIVKMLAEDVFKEGLPFGTFLNVNVPDMAVADMAGVRISRQGIRLFSEYFEKRKDPRNRTYYWQGCDSEPTANPPESGENPEIDQDVLCRNCISITPIKCDMTDYRILERLNNWKIVKELTRTRP